MASAINTAAIQPMVATVSSVCAWVTSSTTTSRNTAPQAMKARRSVMAEAASG
ncbi:MAG: hypothetical protein ACLUIX_05015 [Oscillospiraceae bacterium]